MFLNAIDWRGTMLDLINDYDSYLYGFILADGNLYFNTRNRGKVTIELSIIDEDIIKKIYDNFYIESSISTRERVTNFRIKHKSITWGCYRKEFRDKLLEFGMPKKNKTQLACVPLCKYNKGAFWRGYIEGDGSIGMTKDNEPFISLTISNKDLFAEYITLLQEEFNIIKIINPNKRDNVYNVMVKNEDAIMLGNFIYKDSTIEMNRKYNNYLKFSSWKRLKSKHNKRSWTLDEDSYIKNHSIEESIVHLNRTHNSIKMRLWRLNKD